MMTAESDAQAIPLALMRILEDRINKDPDWNALPGNVISEFERQFTRIDRERQDKVHSEQINAQNAREAAQRMGRRNSPTPQGLMEIAPRTARANQDEAILAKRDELRDKIREDSRRQQALQDAATTRPQQTTPIQRFVAQHKASAKELLSQGQITQEDYDARIQRLERLLSA